MALGKLSSGLAEKKPSSLIYEGPLLEDFRIWFDNACNSQLDIDHSGGGAVRKALISSKAISCSVGYI